MTYGGNSIKETIQVTYSSSRKDVNDRGVVSLLKASGKSPCNNLLIITWGYEAEEKVKGKKIRFIPLWKWHLGD